MFCVECGKEGTIYKNGVCIDCYLKSNSFSKGPSIIDLVVCPHCGAFKHKNTWTSELFGDVLIRIIKDNFKISRELSKIDINPVCKESKEGADCKVYISGFLEKKEITEEHDLQIRYKKTACEVCSKRFGGYHEAIVQIRAEERKLTKDEIKNIIVLVENQVEYLQSKGNRGLFVTDIGEEHGGLNFFISDKGASLVVTKKIQEEYGGRIKQSSKNMGMKDGKQLHRMTYLLRIPAYKKNDFVRLKDSYFLIELVKANQIKMKDLSTWEEVFIEIKNLQKAQIIGNRELIVDYILVSQNNKEVQIMDSKTYEIIIIKKPENIEFIGKTISIVKTEDKLFLYPKIKK